MKEISHYADYREYNILISAGMVLKKWEIFGNSICLVAAS
jgi:hypothetical protein